LAKAKHKDISAEQLLDAYKKKKKLKLSEKQWEKIRDFLAEVPNVLKYLKEQHGYTDKDYDRLKRLFSSHKLTLGGGAGRKGKTPKKKAETVEQQIKKTVAAQEKTELIKLATQVYGDAIQIGKLAQTYGARAAELGYYDDVESKPDLMKFVRIAIEFFIKYRDKVQALTEELLIVTQTGVTVRKGFDDALKLIALIEMTINLIEETAPELRLDLSPLKQVLSGERPLLFEGG
jgi:hypothetical protein